MSQAAILYRISNENFTQLEKLKVKNNYDFNAHSKDAIFFAGSFMAIEFILSKGQEPLVIELIKEVFSPKKYLGGINFSEATTDEEIEHLLQNSDILIPYLEISTISKINSFLNYVSEVDIHVKYSAKELNDNGIYPWVWHDDDQSNMIYNKRQILEDLKELKAIFRRAYEEKDYILVFFD
jgi:Domain of unknown function (DUF1877)